VSVAHGPGSPECREIFARLSEFLDGELDPDLCSRFEGHMDGCPPCQAFLESLRRTIELTRNLGAQELPDDFREELLAAYRKMRAAGEK